MFYAFVKSFANRFVGGSLAPQIFGKEKKIGNACFGSVGDKRLEPGDFGKPSPAARRNVDVALLAFRGNRL